MKSLILSVLSISAVVIIFTFTRPVSAQQLTFSIKPPLLETTIKPGKSLLIAYTISNLGDPSIVSADVRPFQPRGIYGDLVLKDQLEGPIRFSLDNSTIALNKPFFIKSKEGQQLLLKIRVPEGTPEGDYYYTFYVQNDVGKQEEGKTSSDALIRVGANILISVSQNGTLEYGGSIGSFTLKPRLVVPFFGRSLNVFESTDSIPVELILQNTGKNYVKPHGAITLTGGFGEKGTFPIIPQNILSQSSRLAVASSSAQLQDTSLASSKPQTLTLSGFYVGSYTLTAQVAFADGTSPTTSNITFVALPFKLLFASIIALIVGIFVLQQFKKNEIE